MSWKISQRESFQFKATEYRKEATSTSSKTGSIFKIRKKKVMVHNRSALRLLWCNYVILTIKKLLREHSRRWSILGFMPLSGNIVLILSDSGLQSLRYIIHNSTGIY